MTKYELSERLHDLALAAAVEHPQNMIARILGLAHCLSAEYGLPGINPRRPSHARSADPDPQDVGPGAS